MLSNNQQVNPPRVSIFIPTYNRAHLLAQAIESALAQDYPALEIIVSDNASSDETERVVSRYLTDSRLRYIRIIENIGMVRNWAQLLHRPTSAEWFIILSDDDYLTDPTFVRRALALAAEDDDIRMVYAPGKVLYEMEGAEVCMRIPYNRIEDGKRVFINRDKLVKPVEFILCGVLFHRRTAIDLHAFHDPDNISCDADLFFRISLSFKIGVLQGLVCVYRYHGENILTGHKTWAQLVSVLRMYFDLWHEALTKSGISPIDLEEWKIRVLLRACRSFIIETVKFERTGSALKRAIAHLRGHAPDLLSAIVLNTPFLAKLVVARYPNLNKKLIRIRNRLIILRSRLMHTQV